MHHLHPHSRPSLLHRDRVGGFHEWFPPAFCTVGELHHLTALVGDPTALIIDGRLVVATPTHGGRDPGGISV